MKSKALRASTLAEVLVMMIIAAVVFYSVMEGMGLLARFSAISTGRITENISLSDEYFLLDEVITGSDSMEIADNMLKIYSGGGLRAIVRERDSSVVVHFADRTDSLFRGRSSLRYADDTVFIEVRTTDVPVILSLAPGRRRHDEKRTGSEQAEKKYEYGK